MEYPEVFNQEMGKYHSYPFQGRFQIPTDGLHQIL